MQLVAHSRAPVLAQFVQYKIVNESFNMDYLIHSVYNVRHASHIFRQPTTTFYKSHAVVYQNNGSTKLFSASLLFFTHTLFVAVVIYVSNTTGHTYATYNYILRKRIKCVTCASEPASCAAQTRWSAFFSAQPLAIAVAASTACVRVCAADLVRSSVGWFWESAVRKMGEAELRSRFASASARMFFVRVF